MEPHLIVLPQHRTSTLVWMGLFWTPCARPLATDTSVLRLPKSPSHNWNPSFALYKHQSTFLYPRAICLFMTATEIVATFFIRPAERSCWHDPPSAPLLSPVTTLHGMKRDRRFGSNVCLYTCPCLRQCAVTPGYSCSYSVPLRLSRTRKFIVKSSIICDWW